jgi:hypothetical protein
MRCGRILVDPRGIIEAQPLDYNEVLKCTLSCVQKWLIKLWTHDGMNIIITITFSIVQKDLEADWSEVSGLFPFQRNQLLHIQTMQSKPKTAKLT